MKNKCQSQNKRTGEGQHRRATFSANPSAKDKSDPVYMHTDPIFKIVTRLFSI